MSKSIFSKYASGKLEEIASRKNKKASEIDRQTTLDDIESGEFVKDFVKFILDQPRTERDVLLDVKPWHVDYCLVFGDLRLNKIVVSGSAQVFKSLGAFLLTYYATEFRKLSILFTFAKASIRNKIVASTVKPLYDYNRANQTNPKPILVENITQTRTQDYTLYTSFTNNPAKSDKVEVPPELASISVDIVIVDEFQQSDGQIVGVLGNRMNASKLESNPQYNLSTPGSTKTGIDLEMTKCMYVFEAHVTCPHCQKLANLHPLKSFLKPQTILNNDGDEEEKFYDATFRVLDWYHSDPEKPIDSAYIACEHCHGKLDQEVLNTARYFDRDTHMTAEEFHEMVNKDPFKYRSAGLMVNPFLKFTKSYIAPKIAREAVNTDNCKDYLQQKLGIPTSSATDGISHEALVRSVNAPNIPVDSDSYEKVTLIGIDVARGNHYSCVYDAFIPKEGTKQKRYANTIRVIKEFSRISSPALINYSRKMGVEFGAIDLNPEMGFASEICKETGWLPTLQKKSFKEIFKKNKETEAGGIRVEAYDVDNQYFLTTIVNNFNRAPGGQPITVLPDCLRPQLNDPGKTSPIYHYKKFEFDEDKQLWQKPSDESTRCDFLYAQLFTEIALYAWIFSKPSKGWLDFYQ